MLATRRTQRVTRGVGELAAAHNPVAQPQWLMAASRTSSCELQRRAVQVAMIAHALNRTKLGKALDTLASVLVRCGA